MFKRKIRPISGRSIRVTGSNLDIAYVTDHPSCIALMISKESMDELKDGSFYYVKLLDEEPAKEYLKKQGVRVFKKEGQI